MVGEVFDGVVGIESDVPDVAEHVPIEVPGVGGGLLGDPDDGSPGRGCRQEEKREGPDCKGPREAAFVRC